MLFDKCHGRALGCAGDSDSPTVRQQGIQSIQVVTQPALHMIHRVDQAGVHFNLTPPQQFYGAGFANPVLVIAIHIRTHGQLDFVLVRVH